MTTVQFLKKYKMFFNIYKIELECRLRRNTIAHSIGKEERELPLAYEDQIQHFLEKMENDLSPMLVDYWQKHKLPTLRKNVSSSHGVNTVRRHTGKRKTG